MVKARQHDRLHSAIAAIEKVEIHGRRWIGLEKVGFDSNPWLRTGVFSGLGIRKK
jgi:hypothetical protein